MARNGPASRGDRCLFIGVKETQPDMPPLLSLTRSGRQFESVSFGCIAVTPGLLNRWAPHAAVGAKHTAVTGLGTKHSSAAFAVVEDQTSVGRHDLAFFMPADGTVND